MSLDSDAQILRQVDQICDRYEAARREGDTPTLETFLVEIDARHRRKLLRELLTLELSLRADAGEQPHRDEYRTRFPESADVVTIVFEEFQAAAQVASRAATGDQTVGAQLSSWSAASDPSGKQIGDYELLSELGRGGMGVVYRARQPGLDRSVALKTLHSGAPLLQEQQERFRAEARAAAKLRHPGIVPVYDVGETDGVPFFVMELVEGVGLDTWIGEGAMAGREAASIVKEVSQAIQHAHEQGVVHRDIKPSNILIEADGRPRVTDFGLAKQVEVEESPTITGQVIGTPGYMPPEQARGDLAGVNARSDVYSLGAILYSAVTGRPPFQANSVTATLLEVIHKDPVSPRRLNSEVDQDLETICLKCLEKESERRYSTAAELAEELGRYIRHEPIQARPITAIARCWRLSKRHPLVAISTTLAAISLFAVTSLSVAFGVTQRRSAERLESANKGITKQSILTEKQRDRAIAAERKTRGQLFKLYWMNGVIHRDARGQPITASHYFARAAETGESVQADDALIAASAVSLRPQLEHIFQHEEALTGVVASPDGKLLLGWNQAGNGSVWDLENGKLLNRFQHGGRYFATIVDEPPWFHHNDALLLTWSKTTARLWNSHSGQTVKTFKDPNGTKISKAFANAKATRIVTVAGNKAYVWDRNSATPLHEFAHQNSIHGSSLGPQGIRLAIWEFSTEDSQIHLWNINTGKREQKLPHAARVIGATFSHSGRFLASWTYDLRNGAPRRIGRIGLWDIRSGKRRGTMTHDHRFIRGAKFSHDDRQLLSWSDDKTARVWDVSTGRLSRLLASHQAVTAARFTQRGDRIVTGSNDGNIRIWQSGRRRLALADQFQAAQVVSFGDQVNGVEASGQLLLGWSKNGIVKLMDENRTMTISHPQIIGARLGPQSQRMFTWGKDKLIRVWKIAVKSAVTSLTLPSPARGFLLDGSLIAAWERNGTLRLFNSSGTAIGKPLVGAGRAIGILKKDEKVQVIASGSEQGAAKWDALSGTRVATFPHVTTNIQAKLNRSRSHLLITHQIGTELPSAAPPEVAVGGSIQLAAKLWHVDSMKLIQSWDKKDQLTDIRFSPSGQQLVLIAKGLVSVIHAETGKIIRELKGVGAVAGVEVDHDARRLFRRGGNGRATLWDVRSGKQLADFVPEKDSFPRVVRGARFGGLGEQPEGPLFVWGSGSRIGLRDSTTGKPIRSVSIDGRITQIEVLPSGEFLLAMGDALGAEKRVWLFHAPTGTRHAVLKHKHTIWRARFVDGGRHVLTVEARADTQRREDQVTRVHLWSVASGDKLASVFYPTLVTDIDYLESTSQIVARLPQGDVRLWQLPRPTPIGRKTAVLQVEARTGMRLNSNGQLQALDAKTWQAVKGKLNALYRK